MKKLIETPCGRNRKTVAGEYISPANVAAYIVYDG